MGTLLGWPDTLPRARHLLHDAGWGRLSLHGAGWGRPLARASLPIHLVRCTEHCYIYTRLKQPNSFLSFNPVELSFSFSFSFVLGISL